MEPDEVELDGTSLNALVSRRLRVAAAPLATVTELVIEALGRPMGSPPSWPGAVRAGLEPRDLALLASVYSQRNPVVVPDALLPIPETSRALVTDDLDHIADRSADALVEELGAEGLLDEPGWSTAARDPRPWVDSYVRAMRRGWSAVAPLWAQAIPLIERELERVAVAMNRGALDQVLDGLPRGHVAHDRWYPDPDGAPATLTDDLVLIPMVTGPNARLIGQANGAVVDMAYPLPGVHHRVGGNGADTSDRGLEALLGAPRSELLRRLDEPVPAGALADQLQLSPASVTHHLVTLERAGLVRRERRGQRVLVHRTGRGSALLDLYER
jgi:DNA-binding transcriptional ArsR family regulator